MKVSQKMDISILSKVARNELMEDFFKALGLSYTKGEEDIEALQKKVFIFEAEDETLQKWENFMGLEPRKDFSLKDRAERIVYTLRSKGIFTKQFLKDQAKIFTNGEIDIAEDYAGYAFTINFTSIVGLPSNMENFTNMIETNKPAHLNYKFVFRYNTHGQVAFLKHESLKAFTHKQIYDERLYNDSDVAGKFKTFGDMAKFTHEQLKAKTHEQLYVEGV